MRTSKCKMQNAKCEMLNPQIQNADCGLNTKLLYQISSQMCVNHKVNTYGRRHRQNPM